MAIFNSYVKLPEGTWWWEDTQQIYLINQIWWWGLWEDEDILDFEILQDHFWKGNVQFKSAKWFHHGFGSSNYSSPVVGKFQEIAEKIRVLAMKAPEYQSHNGSEAR